VVSHRKHSPIQLLLTVLFSTPGALEVATSLPQAPILLGTHQTEFNMDALPTRLGRPRRTRDMAEIYACICGKAVDMEARVLGSDTALRCAFEGCETSWVRCRSVLIFVLSKLTCSRPPNPSFTWNAFDCAPRGWRCENHATRPRKHARLA